MGSFTIEARVKIILPKESKPKSEQPFVHHMKINGDHRKIKGNGLPNHATGSFPNSALPYPIKKQYYFYKITAYPQEQYGIRPLHGYAFGIAKNGIPFAAITEDKTQNLEVLNQPQRFGLDDNFGHPDRNGAYHYHGLPRDWLAQIGWNSASHSPLIGWARDGFPIYALYGYDQSYRQQKRVTEFRSSYQLRKGKRREGAGVYDGSYLEDYEFVKDSGDLDECNGIFVKTPEFPQGTYGYFLTRKWPVIPRCFKGLPSEDFQLEIKD
ncbi:YHYH protein [Kangiella sp. TOML190]|uniref:YHYH protein n=1 Tax=Kangiella sp. TOML190 TaxID=2931351 RepID=UPI00203F266A|nr:YHYH protein [Kangiella sp. TOML190]